MAILLFLYFFSIINSYKVDGTLPISRTEDLEMERHLNIINKPPIKSIQTKFGQIVDCVDINKQPAFDHPLLKNHKLQRNPTFLHRRARTKKHASPTGASEFGLEEVSCPVGSVPILRTTKDNLIQMKYFSNHTHILTQSSPGGHFAVLRTTKSKKNSYYGVSAHINIQNPAVRGSQMSLAQIAVQNGELDGTNAIMFGWQVAPQIYNQSTTHLFAEWTSDSFENTGCYNMLCSGFVQIEKSVYLGIHINGTSYYGGEQFELPFSISQDPSSKNWWLIVLGLNVGYFPAELFSNMSVANQVWWGGRVSGVEGGASPQMGSGYFPDNNLTHACYIRRLSYLVNFELLEEPQKDLVETYVDNTSCYDLKNMGYLDDKFRYTIQFGGPGGRCGA